MRGNVPLTLAKEKKEIERERERATDSRCLKKEQPWDLLVILWFKTSVHPAQHGFLSHMTPALQMTVTDPVYAEF